MNYAKSSGMNVNKTTPTHSTKQMIINVLFLAYGANDNSIAGLVPHLKLHIKRMKNDGGSINIQCYTFQKRNCECYHQPGQHVANRQSEYEKRTYIWPRRASGHLLFAHWVYIRLSWHIHSICCLLCASLLDFGALRLCTTATLFRGTVTQQAIQFQVQSKNVVINIH